MASMKCENCELLKIQHDALNESYRNMAKLVERWADRERENFKILKLVSRGKYAEAQARALVALNEDQ